LNKTSWWKIGGGFNGSNACNKIEGTDGQQFHPGVNFINVLCTNFLYERHFSSYILALSENLYKKFARLTLMKLTADVKEDEKLWIFSTGVNFINILCTTFAHVEPISVKKKFKSSVFFYAFGICSTKAECKHVVEIDPRSVSLHVYHFPGNKIQIITIKFSLKTVEKNHIYVHINLWDTINY